MSSDHDRDEKPYGPVKQAVADLLNNVSSVVLLAGAALMFGAGAVGGISVIQRLGGAGWIMYAVVIGTYALVFGPVVASAMTLRQKASPRYRAELAKRREQQRIFFKLKFLEAEAEKREAEQGDRDTSR